MNCVTSLLDLFKKSYKNYQLSRIYSFFKIF